MVTQLPTPTVKGWSAIFVPCRVRQNSVSCSLNFNHCSSQFWTQEEILNPEIMCMRFNTKAPIRMVTMQSMSWFVPSCPILWPWKQVKVNLFRTQPSPSGHVCDLNMSSLSQILEVYCTSQKRHNCYSWNINASHQENICFVPLCGKGMNKCSFPKLVTRTYR